MKLRHLRHTVIIAHVKNIVFIQQVFLNVHYVSSPVLDAMGTNRIECFKEGLVCGRVGEE